MPRFDVEYFRGEEMLRRTRIDAPNGAQAEALARRRAPRGARRAILSNPTFYASISI